MSSRLFGIFVGFLVAVVAAFTYFYIYDRDRLPSEMIEVVERTRPERPGRLDPAPQTLILPTFDIVRVDAEGTSVIAGRGESKAVIVVFANGEEAAREPINEAGEWAVYIDTPFAGRAVELTLEMVLPGGEVRKGEQVIVIAVPERSGEKPLVVLGSPGQPSRVLQSPRAGDETLVLTLDIVDYDAEGALVLSGRADKGAALRVYANNEMIGETRASEQGAWTLRPQIVVRPGLYQLRIDQLDESGKVKLRIELPLERAEPAEVLAAVAKGGGRVVVQPGNSLWRIARRIYGSGFEYTIIYDANQDQIRDPNLIYPGQIFDLPKKTEVDDELHLMH